MQELTCAELEARGIDLLLDRVTGSLRLAAET